MERAKPIVHRLFGIPFDFTFSGTVGASYVSKYTISTNFDFMWEITNVYKDGTRDFTLNIRDEFTSEDMFVSAMYASTITGDGKNPFVLPRPYIFLGGTTITVTANDTLGGAAMKVQVVLVGYKVKMPRG